MLQLRLTSSQTQEHSLEHVLCVPMAFAAGSSNLPDRRVAFTCTCPDMASRVESIVSRSAAKMTYAGRPVVLSYALLHLLEVL